MTILTRYVIRTHIGPFLFAFTAVTGLLFLNAIAQRMENLAGRGLGIDVIGEFMMLSVPHIVALTFPMAVLVAVLHTFSDLMAKNEVMAIAAGGIHPMRVLAPLLVVGLGLSALMFWFNAQVLPESNHRLSNLMGDIASTNPTLELREEIVNEVTTGDGLRYQLRARQVDSGTNTLTDVTIFDQTRMGEHRVIRARNGTMAFSPDLADLYLTLTDGSAYEITDDRPGVFQRMDFDTQVLPMRGVGAEVERRTGRGSRGDREMTIPMLRDYVEGQLVQLANVSNESMRASLLEVHAIVGVAPPPSLADATGRAASTGESDDPAARLDANAPPSAGGGIAAPGDAVVAHRVNQARWNVYRTSVHHHRVEIHKKFAIAFACFLFILLGAPFAMRFPQGGVGMVIATSVSIFFLYWMGLIGGERVAERGYVEPWLAMWLPNIVLGIPAMLLPLQMGSRLSTNRGGGFDALRFRVAGWFRRERDA